MEIFLEYILGLSLVVLAFCFSILIYFQYKIYKLDIEIDKINYQIKMSRKEFSDRPHYSHPQSSEILLTKRFKGDKND